MACPICLPISVDHKVSIERVQANFTRRGKGGHLILTSDANCGPGLTASPVDTTDRSKTYSTIEEVAADWDASCPAYQQAVASFSQVPSSPTVTIAFYDDAAANIQNELDAVYECAQDWFVVTTPNLKDDPRQVDFAAWVAAKAPRHLYSALTCDPATLDPNDTSSLKYMLTQAGYPTLLNYVAPVDANVTPLEPSCYLDAGIAGIIATQDFDTGSGYTLYNKTVVGCPPTYLTQTELATLKACNVNTQVCIAGKNVYRYGALTDGTWADDCHLSCWFQARFEEGQFEADIVDGPRRYTREGYNAIIDRYSAVAREAQLRGLITGDRFNELADQERGYVVNAPRYEDITDSQFSSREGVCISLTTFSAGFIQGTCLEFTLRV